MALKRSLSPLKGAHTKWMDKPYQVSSKERQTLTEYSNRMFAAKKESIKQQKQKNKLFSILKKEYAMPQLLPGVVMPKPEPKVEPVKQEHELVMLTEQQQRIKNLILKGFTVAEMAAELKIAPKTVKFHTTNLYKIEKVKSKANLIVKYLGYK